MRPGHAKRRENHLGSRAARLPLRPVSFLGPRGRGLEVLGKLGRARRGLAKSFDGLALGGGPHLGLEEPPQLFQFPIDTLADPLEARHAALLPSWNTQISLL